MTERFHTIDGETLMKQPLSPIRFVVEGLLSHGLHLLAGAPKSGKSWLALWLSVTVAKGEEVWGNKVQQGTTLYLCFEDSRLRIQNRLFDITEDAPPNVHFCEESVRLGEGLEERIGQFVLEHPGTVLIIIDTLQMIRRPTVDNSYANDYADLTALKRLADKNGIAILLIHHLRKQKDDAPFNRISGTTGLSGAVDASFTLVEERRGSGKATLSIPYTPNKNEAVGYLFGVYVDAQGKATRIPGSTYDPNSGSILLGTNHFSVYGVGYQAPSAKFTDIGSHWAKESIDYVVGRGLLSGTSKTTFAPNTAMKRGVLVTALGRLAGVDVKAYTTSSFTDVKADSVFRPYIEWAYSKGIMQGISNSRFAPDRAVTREEIAVIFTNFAKATGYKLPVTREAATYADASSISSSYSAAVQAMQQAGIMMGGTGNKFSPKASATRAEVSAMLHRYIKLTIDPATAQGWAKNDAGEWLYYKDSKALTGTQTIDGVKYFFNTNGSLVRSAKVDGYGIGQNGVRKDK